MPRAFLSYAHADSFDFVRRLAFGLGLYCEVFWDQRLPPGDFGDELEREIETSTDFVLVMSPFSLRDDSYCRKEFSTAIERERRISLIKLIRDTGHPFEDEICSTYTYADFSSGFEPGFRRLTQLLLGTPCSSWEALTSLENKRLLQALSSGLLPGLIAKEITEWVIIAKLWPVISEYSAKQPILVYANPHTATGVWSQTKTLREQFITNSDQLGMSYCDKVLEIIESALRETNLHSDDKNLSIGIAASAAIEATRSFLLKHAVGTSNALNSFKLSDGGYFTFETADKLRELINLHARRSRYLY